MKRVVWVAIAAVVALGLFGCASGPPPAKAATAVTPPAAATAATPITAATPTTIGTTSVAVTEQVATATKTYALTAGGLKRSYEVIAPVTALPESAPIIVMLAGIGATVSGEIVRDDLVPYATSNQAEIVYPVPIDESWNAIGCCGEAATKNVNDVAFLQALVPQLDPGHARPIYVVGYSNGARLAYRIACDDPSLFDGYAMVKGEPTADCTISKPVNIIQLASANDPEVPYEPGDHGSVESLAVTTLVADLHTVEKCPAAYTVAHSGTVTVSTWSGCAGGTRLGLAVWQGGVHSFPRPPASVPAASQVIWSFFTQTLIAPLPS